MEVAVNLTWAVVLYLDTRGHCRAFRRSRADLRRQHGWSAFCSEVRGPQGRHRWEDSGGAAGGGVCLGV